jgi:hypothetical protein
MEVVCFLYVSLGGNTIQLRDSLGQVLVSVVKMAAVLKECITEEQRSVVLFLWKKGHNEKDIHKEIFPVYGGKCLSCKAFENWVKKLPSWCHTFR